MEEEKTLLVFNEEDGLYYNIHDFLDFLTKGRDDETTLEEYELYLEGVYINTRIHIDFMEAMMSLHEQGKVERFFEENGEPIKLTPEEQVKQDIEMRETIGYLNNTIDEYREFFDKERINRLDDKVEEIWAERKPNGGIEL